MDVEKPVGAALSRDISRSNWDADAEIDRFIERQSVKLRRENQERREAEAWAESTRKANATREAELKAAWCESTTRSKDGVTGLSWRLWRAIMSKGPKS